jgi:hypothetical protein
MAIAHPAIAAPREQAAARAERAPGSAAVAGLVAISLAVGVLVLYALWKFWPTEDVLKNTSATKVNILGIHRLVTPEVRLLVVVALAGSLGGLMHSTRSLAWYVGHKALVWRWVPYYLVTIVIGAGLASIFYLVIRGGVLGGNASTAQTNPYGFAALGALVGLFTEQALEMLRRVANQVFAAPPQGADSVASSTTTDASTGTDTAVDAPAFAAVTGVASSVTASSATLEGDVSSEDPQTTYHFDYGTTTGYGSVTSTLPVDNTTPQQHVTADVNGLTPGATYHFRLVVEDGTGSWTTGQDATFTTPAG